jgi:hypothetical protein
MQQVTRADFNNFSHFKFDALRMKMITACAPSIFAVIFSQISLPHDYKSREFGEKK